MMRAITGDYKRDNLVYFFSANPESQKSKWASGNGYINSILPPSDDIAFTLEDEYNLCNVNVNFGGSTKNLEVVLNKTARSA
jgi:hypothetical protein